MGNRGGMALVVLSDADARLEEATAFAASGAAMGMRVRVLVTGPALGRFLAGRLPGDLAARLAEARTMGDVRLFACSAAVRRAGATPASVVAGGILDEILGVPAFLEHLAAADVQLVF